MGYNLTIDQGNSVAKLVVWQGDVIVNESRCDCLSVENINTLTEQFAIDVAIYCSVATSGDEIVEALNKTCRQVISLSHNTPLPIKISYTTPETLGKDRLAAAVGAWSLHQGHTILVVDMGTAVTYDVVTADNCFLGGNIAPGLEMRLNALNHFTARLPKVDLDGNAPLWGIDTETALRSGAIHGVAGEISYYRSKLPDDTIVLLTGHMSETIASLVDFPVEIEPHLVTKGLNRILIYNETK